MQQLQVVEASSLLEVCGQLSSSSTPLQSPSESSESEADPDPAYSSCVLDLSFSTSVPSPDLPSPQPSSTSSPLAPEWEPLSPYHTASPESNHSTDEQGVMVSNDTTQEQNVGGDVVQGPGLSPWFGFKMVGDIDKMIKPRYMRTDRQNQSLHYFHMYAVRDRINLSESCENQRQAPKDPPLEELLPSPDDSKQLHSNMEILVTRILARHMPFIAENFEDVVIRHIPHPYLKEMAQKSEVVSFKQY